ncbi:OLC1v1007241C1 [Oldenlandia corymbosa var. corymbosa]|uniref:OLC1v1007241C1 n=1 Tax=Oldenlandia corymbosa var. corymbosa TaxID=529605 RepID=A0AAV1DJ45_OLDCO|nr:OLC1v1007241C1 [Oldenlandia corymbosa var. corymbosa]
MGFNSFIEDHHPQKYIKCCDSDFFLQLNLVIVFILVAGLMNGLTLGYMSINRVDLEVLQKSGSSKTRFYASRILPLVKKRHLLLCTLITTKAFAVEALPIFLHHLVPETPTILISAALILLFSEIIPHAVCSKYGLVIGAALAPAIHCLVWICFPVAYPTSKLLDLLLGKGRIALYRRAELKTLFDLLGNKAGKGGDLSHHEVSIIQGALELTEKTAKDAMTLASEIFAVDINAKLDRNLINLILQKGHSRVPVFHGHANDIIGLILVKNLLTLNPEDEVPIKNITIRSIPRIPETMLLVELLNQFQRGLSHMAVVVRPRNGKAEKASIRPQNNEGEVRLEIDGERLEQKRSFRRSLRNLKTSPGIDYVSRRESSRSRRWSGESHPEILNLSNNPLVVVPPEEEVVGIITMEDVIEELLKEDIYDEMDHYGSSQASSRGFSRRIFSRRDARCGSNILIQSTP